MLVRLIEVGRPTLKGTAPCQAWDPRLYTKERNLGTIHSSGLSDCGSFHCDFPDMMD